MAAPTKKPAATLKDFLLAGAVFGGLLLYGVYWMKSCGEEKARVAALPQRTPPPPPVREPQNGREEALRNRTAEFRKAGFTPLLPDRVGDEDEPGVSRLLIDNLGVYSMSLLLDGEEIFEFKVIHQDAAEVELRSGDYDLFIVSDRPDVPPAGSRVTLGGVYHLALQVQGDEQRESATKTCTGEHQRVRSLPR